MKKVTTVRDGCKTVLIHDAAMEASIMISVKLGTSKHIQELLVFEACSEMGIDILGMQTSGREVGRACCELSRLSRENELAVQIADKLACSPIPQRLHSDLIYLMQEYMKIRNGVE